MGLDPLIHLSELTATRMAGNMDHVVLLGNDPYAAFCQLVLQFIDRNVIARNDFGGKDNGVPLFHNHLGMGVIGNSGERCTRFTLRARAQIEHFVLWQLTCFVVSQKWWNVLKIAARARC